MSHEKNRNFNIPQILEMPQYIRNYRFFSHLSQVQPKTEKNTQFSRNMEDLPGYSRNDTKMLNDRTLLA